MNANHTQVSKSSAECAAHNLQCAAEIELGLSLPWEPTQAILDAEAREAKQKAAGLKVAADKLAVLRMIDPAVTEATQNKVCGVNARIERVESRGSRWSSGNHAGWRLVLGSLFGKVGVDKQLLVIGDGTTLGLNDKQLAKAKAHIASLQAHDKRVEDMQGRELAKCLRYKALYASDKALIGAICQTSYVSEYGQMDFAVNADGSITYKYETFTVPQWREIVALRDAQAAAMKALKESFKPATA